MTLEFVGQPAPALGAHEERPRLVFFHSKLSGRCRRAEGFLAQVLQRRQNHDTFVVHHVDIEERPDLFERMRVDQIPALLVVDGRKVAARVVQPRGCREIERALAPWLK